MLSNSTITPAVNAEMSEPRLPWLVPQLKARPLRGSGARLIPPASWTLNPRIRASLPIAAPPSRASCGLKLEPIKNRVT